MRIVRVAVLAGRTYINGAQTVLTTGLVSHKIFLCDVIALREHSTQSGIFRSRGWLTEGHGRCVRRGA